jgi:hypothetical protein
MMIASSNQHYTYSTSSLPPKAKIIMKVTIDRYRILNLIILLACSSILAEIIISKFEWARLSAYGFTITICVQISNAINKLNLEQQQNNNNDAAEKKRLEKSERVLEKRAAGLGKKKR